MPADPIWGQLILQVVLIAINAFFAASEFALVSLDENKLRAQAEEGDKFAVRMLKMISSPNGFLSAIQIAITLAGFLNSAFAADGFSEPLMNWLRQFGFFASMNPSVLNTVCVVIITLILSYFSLVFGELVPKRVAMQKTEAVARAVSGVIFGFATITRPIVWLLSVSTNGVLRLLRIDPNAQTEEITEEDIRMRADIAEEKGAITEAEGEMIDNVFEFNNHTAFDVMTHRTDVVALPVDATDDEILRVIRESGLSRIPVYEKTIDDVVGILRTREYLLYRAMDEYKPLRTILHTPNFVPETVRTDVLFRSMQQKKNHIAIVVDEYGGVSGLVSMEDLLEEIVGNIYDEYDPQVEQAVTKVGDNLWRVSGICELSVLSEALDIALPLDEDYDTLSGLVFSQLSSIPQDGSHPELDVAGLHIYVEEISDHRVEWAQVSKIYPEEEDESDAGAEKSAS